MVYGRMYHLEPFRKDITMAQKGVGRGSGGVRMGSPHGYTPSDDPYPVRYRRVGIRVKGSDEHLVT